MSARMRENHWQMTAQKRRRPGAGDQIHIPWDSTETLIVDPACPPSELVLDTTNASGEPADWLDDFFWMPLLQAWSNETLTVRIAATPQALLNSVVLHHVSMLRRVAPAWRVVGHCHVNDLAIDGAINITAQSPYHEVHVMDGPRPGEGRPAHPLRLEDALARIRRVQVANGRTMPIIVCARPQVDAAGSSAGKTAHSTARPQRVHAG